MKAALEIVTPPNNDAADPVYAVNKNVPGGTVGYPAHPRLIRPSVILSVIPLLSFLRKIA
jgi:hypothetical protein